MKNRKCLIPIFVGLFIGQVFAEGTRPFHVSNTIRFGYSDNVDREPDGTAKSSTYVTDTIDFSFAADLSDRTDLLLKSQIVLRSDTAENDIYPNLYAVLSHQVSPRLLMSLSEYYKGGETSTGTRNGRHNYFVNNVGVNATYVLTEKDRLDSSLDYKIKRHDSSLDDLDSTTVELGLGWEREWIPQRTTSKVNLRERWIDLPNNAIDLSKEETDLTLEIAHTFNPSWQARVEGGCTYTRLHFDKAKVVAAGGNADDGSRLNPLFKASLIYSPSPRTRVNGGYVYKYVDSSESDYGAQIDSEFSFGVLHEITEKVTAKANVRYLESKRDAKDGAGAVDFDSDRFEFDFRLTYQLNRINFINAGYKYTEVGYDQTPGSNWEENRFEMGWRVDL